LRVSGNLFAWCSGQASECRDARFLDDPVAHLRGGWRQLGADRPDQMKFLAGDPAPRQHRYQQAFGDQ